MSLGAEPRGLLTLGETLALVSSAVPGPLAHADVVRLGVGGAESNVAIGVRRLGVPATWVGRVGDDPLGARVLRELRGEGLDVAAVVDPAAATALMVKERRTTSIGSVTYYRAGSAGSRLATSDVPPGSVESCAAVHLTGITPGLSDSALEAVRDVVARARVAAVPVSFDVNHRDGVWNARDPRPVYRELASAARTVFAGPGEARLLTGSQATDPTDLLDALGAASGGDAVLKLGADGCLALLDGERHSVAAHRVEVVDTVGAGDAFVAGYLAETVLGVRGRSALETATLCGAFACLTAGDWEGLPTRAELVLLGATEGIRR